MIKFINNLFVSKKEIKREFEDILKLQTEFLDSIFKLSQEIKKLKEDNIYLSNKIRTIEDSFFMLSDNVRRELTESKEELNKINYESTIIRRVNIMNSLLEKHEIDYEDKLRLNNLSSTYIDYLENEIKKDHKIYLNSNKKENKDFDF